MLCTASGVAFLQQMDGFIGICRHWAEVWMGLDGSATEGRTMGSCSNDNELSRAITSRSSAHKKKSGYTASSVTCTVCSPLIRKQK